MLWWDRHRDELSDLNSALEEALDGKSSKAHKGYGNRALNLRHQRRDSLKRNETTGEQILEEEKKALDLARKRKPKSWEAGENIADETVNKSFWDRLFGS